jgi:hypothetical protein
MGGPNIIPEEDGPIATCVANAPGGPVHVLETDEIAEHVPGCNLSVRRDVLMKIGGFDPLYRSAGDDVDVCWRIQDAGYTIGFHPSALVWHHRRNSLKAYWKQQKGYGKAEALLESKWPEKYNSFGHLTWAGRIYGNGFTLPIKTKKDKVFHGTWGSSLFQSIYQPADGLLNCIPLMPEYYILTGLFGVLATIGFAWPPLLWMWLLFAISIVTILFQASISSAKNTSLSTLQSKNWKYTLLIIILHIIQPMARLNGRIKHGLTPWRKRGDRGGIGKISLLKSQTLKHWSEAEWKANETWLEELENNIIKLHGRVKRGGDFDRWDLQVQSGLFTTAKSILTVEEHGSNKQYIKLRYWTNYSVTGLIIITSLSTLTFFAAMDKSWIAGGVLAVLTSLVLVKYIIDSSSVVNCMVTAFNKLSLEVQKDSHINIIHSNSPIRIKKYDSMLEDSMLEDSMLEEDKDFYLKPSTSDLVTIKN